MRRPAFDALDRDWAELIRGPAAREALERWSTEPALLAMDLDVKRSGSRGGSVPEVPV